jgi:hypothetical protein
MNIGPSVNLGPRSDSTLDLEFFIYTSICGRTIQRLFKSLMKYANQNTFKIFITTSGINKINNRRIILPQNNVYENDSKSSVELLPGRRFALQQIFVDLPRKTSKTIMFSHIF